VLASLLLLGAAACGGPARPGGAASGTAAAPAPTATPLALPPGMPSQPLARVALIVLENHGFSQIIGNSCCPYLNALAARGSLFTNYTAVTHPSLPNYLALTSGGLQGKKGTDNTSPIVDAPNLFAQLSARGMAWRAYEQTMPAPCYRERWRAARPATTR
jgi:phosphatidylinositol-3-phosphatase